VSSEYDPYEDWKARNAAWFEDTVQVARQAIADAKTTYGEEWENHCDWRMYKSLWRTSTSNGPVTDSICVRIINRGADIEGKGSPASNDSVYISLRGWLMPTINFTGNGEEMGLVQDVITTSYYGEYDPAKAAPQLMSISSLVEGFSTALQYMVEDDDWMIFIPQTLAYGASSQGTVKEYSTLQFRVHLVKWYESGTGIPTTCE
jgi:FKBP-type peptidyl-prolyl cis-trans isomerase FklB